MLRRPGWTAGNSIVLLLRRESGEGRRHAESFRQGTPQLQISWSGEMVLGSSGLDRFTAGQRQPRGEPAIEHKTRTSSW